MKSSLDNLEEFNKLFGTNQFSYTDVRVCGCV